MLTDTPATVYNRYKNRETGEIEWHRTVLRDVHWAETVESKVMATELLTAEDATSVEIWFLADSEGKQYLRPGSYAAQPPDVVSHHWTMTPGVDKLVHGIGPELPEEDTDAAMAEIVKQDGCFTVRAVSRFDFGSPDMRHWEVELA